MRKTKEKRDSLGEARYAAYWEIRGHLHRSGHETVQDVARIAGTSDVAVHRTLRGFLHTPRVLDALRACGVPDALLFDPREMENRVSASHG